MNICSNVIAHKCFYGTYIYNFFMDVINSLVMKDGFETFILSYHYQSKMEIPFYFKKL
jgi:hypothetical protein